MRILHTSDWHLGRPLHGRSRRDEHEAFLDEVVEVASDVDLVLISGDVFESTNPPIDAEQLFFDVLARLGDGGRRAVVVIAGNHDSPDRLTAAAPLAAKHGVFLLGRPGDLAVPRVQGTGVRLESPEPSLLRLALPGGERAVIAAVPYPSEARLRQLLSASLDPHRLQGAYEARIREVFASLAQGFEPGAVNLAMSHLAISSCMPSPSERALVGGAFQVAGTALPAAAQYTALGHLHLAQPVVDAPNIARYAGAPLAFRFSERDNPRAHVFIDVVAGGQADVSLLPIRAGRPLVQWTATLQEITNGVEQGLHAGAFIDLQVKVDTTLSHTDIARLKRLPRDFVRIAALYPESVVTRLHGAGQRRADLPIPELFSAFFRSQTGREPSSDLVDLFVSLVTDDAAARAAG